jgi:hypothetical protein
MSGLLNIDKGSPKWWLSNDIWGTPASGPTTPPGLTDPSAGQPYNVSVRVHDKYSQAVSSEWNLFLCWAIPTAGPIPVPPAASGQILNNAAISVLVPAMGTVQLAPIPWTPVFENGGHECLVAMAYNEQTTGFPVASLNGDAPDTDTYSIAQKNLGVLAVGSQMRRFQYAFQVTNGADEERSVVIEARQAPLGEIEGFLPGLKRGRSVIDQPGKVENVGIVESHQPVAVELERAKPVLSRVRIEPRGCRPFTLGGSLAEGNALIHVTQSLNDRVVGGLSVLVMAARESRDL